MIQRKTTYTAYFDDPTYFNYEIMLDLFNTCILLREYIPVEMKRPRGFLGWSRVKELDKEIWNIPEKEWEKRIADVFNFYDDILIEEEDDQ